MKTRCSLNLSGVYHSLKWITIAALLGFHTSAFAIFRTWTAGSGKWSTAANWSPAGAPQNGDELVFNNSPGSDMTNDITGLSVQTMEFIRTGAIWGNSLTVTVGIQGYAAESGALALNIPTLYLGGNVSIQANNGTGWPFTLNCTTELNGYTLEVESQNSGSVNFQAPITGAGQVIFQGGNNTLAFTSGSGITAPVRVTAGILYLSGLSSVPAIVSQLEIDSAAQVQLYSDNQIGSGASVIITAGSQLLLRGYSDTIGSLVFTNLDTDTLPSLVNTGSGTLGLNGPVSAWNYSGTVIPALKGRMNLNGVLPFYVGGPVYAGLDVQATMGGVGGISKSGNSTLILETNNTYSGAAFVNQGILDVRNNSALGAIPGILTLSGNGALTLQNVIIGGETLVISGQSQIVPGVFGSLMTSIGSCGWAGPVILNTNLIVYEGDIILDGPISGPGGIQFLNDGTSIIGGADPNSYTGTTVVQCALLELAKPANVTAFAGPLVVGGGLKDIETRWLSSFQGPGQISLTMYENATVNLNGFTDGFGAIIFNSGTFATGTGQANLYGSVTVNSGYYPSELDGNLYLVGSGQYAFNIGQGTGGGVYGSDLELGATISGNGGILKSGDGFMGLDNANTYSGVTTVAQGVLQINDANALGGTSQGTVVQAGATLEATVNGVTINEPLTLAGGGEYTGDVSGALVILDGDNDLWAGPVALGGLSVIAVGNANTNTELHVSGTISGTGPLIKNGPGILSLTGSANNTYSGDTLVKDGALTFLKFTPNVVAVPGNLIIGPGPSAGSPATVIHGQNGGVGSGNVTVNGNAIYNVHGFSQFINQLTLEGGSVQTGTGFLDFSGGTITVGATNGGFVTASSSIGGSIGLEPNSGGVNFNVGRYLNPAFFSGAELEVPALIFVNGPEQQAFAPAGIKKNGGGRLHLSANNPYRGSASVNGGTLQIDGSQPQSSVSVNGGILRGTGTVGYTYMGGAQAAVSPGNGLGILTCSNFNNGGGSGILQSEIAGTTPGSGYDQLNVFGSVNLNGLSLSAQLDYVPAIGSQFTLINNDGTDPVIGTFVGLPQGTNFSVGEQYFTINYAGGSGNDVVITAIPPPPAPGTWTTNSPLQIARLSHTATLLPDGKVLLAGGGGSSNAPNSAELYDPATGTTATTGSLTVGRFGHTATLLPNGKVLVVGGQGTDNSTLASAELYDPLTGNWTFTGPLNTARQNHTASLLPNGKVLVAGGYNSSAELYDPTSGVWTPTGSMITNLSDHTATLLANGKVLVAGGYSSGGRISVAQLYDPSTGKWTATGMMTTNRADHTATLLPNGKVLVAGGAGVSTFLASAELYDPAAGSWSSAGAMSVTREFHSATLLPDGNVLITGGSGTTNFTTEVELYNPSSGKWAVTGALNTARSVHTATLLSDGRVLVAGGETTGRKALSSTELFDPTVGTWATTGVMTIPRFGHTATLLPDGDVLVTGSFGAGTINSTERYDAERGFWTPAGPLATNRWYHTATLLGSGKVLVAGGMASGGNTTASAELYDSLSETWAPTGPLNTARSQHTATLMADGRVLVTGGADQNQNIISSTEIYSPSNGVWLNAAAMISARYYHSATLLPNGQVLVTGGLDQNDAILASAELYDPVANTWIATNSMTAGRYGHVATLLPDGKVLVSGGNGLASAELYEPSAGSWTATGSLSVPRTLFTATLLLGGKVLAAGGYNYGTGGGYLNSAELYDPATGLWSPSGSLIEGRDSHTATLLSNGKILVTGGISGMTALDGAELYDAGMNFSNSWQPQITSITSPLSPPGQLLVGGLQFRGISEASGGGTQNSSTAYPLLQLRSIESGQTVFLATTNWTDAAFVSQPVTGFPLGFALATVIVNGIPGSSSIISVAPVPAAIFLTHTTRLGGGSIQFSFTNTPGVSFTALGTTNLSLPANNWTFLGVPVETTTGYFQFNDPGATNYPQRFYRVRSP